MTQYDKTKNYVTVEQVFGILYNVRRWIRKRLESFINRTTITLFYYFHWTIPLKHCSSPGKLTLYRYMQFGYGEYKLNEKLTRYIKV